MTDQNDSSPPAVPSGSVNVPEPQRRRQSRWLPSLVWLIPIVAIVIGLSLLISALKNRGPSVTVSFSTADGLQPGKTRVRYKDVDIGLVKNITLSEDRSHIEADIDLIRDAKGFNVKDTRFWVVRPRLALGGVSGLDTLLSGAYIGVDIGKSKENADVFKGLEEPPVITTGASGRQFVLHADNLGSLDVGSPVYYRRIQVGQVAAYKLDPDGKGITVRVFVNHPFDALVSGNTRFWHASGFDIKVDASGLTVNTQSLVTVLLGGVAFQTPDGAPADNVAAPENAEFSLKANQTDAMREPEGVAPVLAVVDFSQSVRGLRAGAPVDFRGVNIGQVRSIGIEYNRRTHEFNIPVTLEVYPGRLGFSQHEVDADSAHRELLQGMLKHGLRAQLKNGNLLTGQLFVALDFFKNAKNPAGAGRDFNVSDPIPHIPSVPGGLDELQSSAERIASRLEKIPFEDIGNNLKSSLAELDSTLKTAQTLITQINGDVVPEFRQALTEARKTASSANQVLSSDAPLQQDMRRALQEVSRSATSLRNLTDYLESHPEALVRGKVKGVNNDRQ